MKAYLVVFFVLWGFVGFGQNPEEPATNEIYCVIDFPAPEKGFFDDADHKHFQELFPSEKLKEQGIKRINIKLKDEDDIPTIRVQSSQPYYKYILNNDGFVIKSESITDSYRHSFFYKRNGFNQIVYSRDSAGLRIFQDELYFVTEKKYTYNSKTVTELSNTTMSGSGIVEYDTVLTIKTYDQLDRLSHIFLDYTRSFISDCPFSVDCSYINRTFNYDEKEHFGCSYNDTIFFDENWRPIREKEHRGRSPDLFNQKEIIYNSNNQIESLKIIVDYEDEKSVEEEVKKDVTIITFHYDSNDLLEKIIQTTDQGTCEYQVYYYTD